MTRSCNYSPRLFFSGEPFESSGLRLSIKATRNQSKEAATRSTKRPTITISNANTTLAVLKCIQAFQLAERLNVRSLVNKRIKGNKGDDAYLERRIKIFQQGGASRRVVQLNPAKKRLRSRTRELRSKS